MDNGSTNIKQYVTRFLRFCEYQGLHPLTIERHRFNLKSFIPWLGKRDITKDTLREFIFYTRNRKARTNNGLSKKKGLSINAVNSYVSTLKRFVHYLWTEEGFIKEDLTGAIRSLRPDTFMPVLLTSTEIYSIIHCPRTWGIHHKWVDRRKYDFFFELLACMGLRKFEALNLKVGDFDFTESVLRVNHGKGNKSRLIPIPKAFERRIKGWFDDRRAKPNQWVFNSRKGTKIGYSTFKDELTKRANILGIKKRTYMHLFRHCFITELIKSEVAALKVARIVGHSSLNTTMRYTHLVVDDLKEPMEKHPLNLFSEPEDRSTNTPTPIFRPYSEG